MVAFQNAHSTEERSGFANASRKYWPRVERSREMLALRVLEAAGVSNDKKKKAAH